MDILVSVVLPLGLAFIMFSLGVGLTVPDFTRVAQRPGAFLVGAANQIILLPIVAYALIIAFGIRGEIAVGFMILSACPGGVTSNVISRMARADVALSVTLTAVISLLSVITVPIILSFAMGAFLGADAPEVNIIATALTMFLITVVPISIGVALRRAMPDRMIRLEPVLARVAVALFVIIIAAAVAANWELFITNLALLGPALVVLVVVLTALGYALPRLLGRNRNEAKTISIETGIQNGTLGIAVAGIIATGDPFSPYMLASAVYGVVMYLTIIPALLIYRRMD